MKRAFCWGVLLLLACSPEIQVETMVNPATNQVTEEYQYYLDDDSGNMVRHGFYRSYHTDGTPMETGQYKHGRKKGEWVYHQKGAKRIGTFADDRLVGVYSYYDSEGRKIREGS